jgi:hypothetical protein
MSQARRKDLMRGRSPFAPKFARRRRGPRGACGQLGGNTPGEPPIDNALLRTVSRAAQPLAFLVPYALYTASLSSEPSAWDTAEMQTVPYILGIAHPTGFPLYVLFGWLWSHALPLGTVAFRMNLLSAAAVASSCWLLYRTALLLDCSPLAALAGALVFAFGTTTWWNAERADVHSLALVLGALTIYALVRWHIEGDPRLLALAAAALGLGLAVHPVVIWLVPGFVLLVALDYGRRRVDAGLLARCLALGALGLAFYAYLPLRSQYVSAHHIDPIAALPGVDSFLFDYLHPASPSGFRREVTGSDFSAGDSAVTAALAWWRYGSFAARWLLMVLQQYGLLAVPLTLAGIVGLVRRDGRLAAALVVLGFGALPFSFAYSIESAPDRYRLLSMWFMGLAVAAAPQAFGALPSAVLWKKALTALACCAALDALWLNVGELAERSSPGSRPLIRAVATAVPKGSVVVAPWFDATALGYAAYVDGSLPDRIIVSAHPEEVLDWQPEATQRRPIYLLSQQALSIEKGRAVRIVPGVPDRFLYLYQPRKAAVKGSAGRST